MSAIGNFFKEDKQIKELKNSSTAEKLDSVKDLINSFSKNDLAKAESQKIIIRFIQHIFTEQELCDLASVHTEDFYLRFLILSLREDKNKINYINMLHKVSDKLFVLESVKEKKYILEYLNSLPNHNYDIETFIFASGKISENAKLEYILYSLSEGYKSALYLARHLKNDDNIVCVARYLLFCDGKKAEITDVLREIKSPDKMLEIISLFGNCCSFDIIKALRTVDDDNKKILYADTTDSSYIKLLMIASIHDDKLKIPYFSCFSNPDEFIKINNYLITDSVRVDLLNHCPFDFVRERIIDSIKDDDCKLRVLDLGVNRFEIVHIIKNLTHDSLKIEYLDKFDFNDDDIITIICSIKDKELKRDTLDKRYPVRGKEIYRYDYQMDNKTLEPGQDSLPEDMTIGVEIEAVGEYARIIREKRGQLLGQWDIKSDDSIKNGVEITSKVLHYNHEDMNQINNVCDFAEKNELSADDSCGGHLHFGSNFLVNSTSWYWLYYMYCNCEKIFYLISNEPGVIPRTGIDGYAKPISKQIQGYLERQDSFENMSDTIAILQSMFEEHYAGINISNIGKVRETIEFRIPNGTVNPKVIEQNILLFGNLLKLARKLSILPLDKTTFTLINTFDSSNDNEEEKVHLLLSLLFKEEKLRDIFYERYRVNRELYDESKLYSIETNQKTIKIKSKIRI